VTSKLKVQQKTPGGEPPLEVSATGCPPFDRANVGFSRALRSRYRKRGGTEVGTEVTDGELKVGLAGSTQAVDVELNKSLVDKARETGNKSPETRNANLWRYFVESVNGAVAIEITQGKNMGLAGETSAWTGIEVITINSTSSASPRGFFIPSP
jgi:hypothetical protein